MHKRAASAQQMLTRTANHSTKGSAKGFVDGIGENPAAVLNEHERKEARRRGLQAELVDLQQQLARQKEESNRLLHARDMSGHHASITKCNSLREQIERKRAEVTELNPKSRRLPSSLVERAFVDICKETMPKAQFDLIMRQAHERVRALPQPDGPAADTGS